MTEPTIQEALEAIVEHLERQPKSEYGAHMCDVRTRKNFYYLSLYPELGSFHLARYDYYHTHFAEHGEVADGKVMLTGKCSYTMNFKNDGCTEEAVQRAYKDSIMDCYEGITNPKPPKGDNFFVRTYKNVIEFIGG